MAVVTGYEEYLAFLLLHGIQEAMASQGVSSQTRDMPEKTRVF
jgi:hypothetical protein